MNITKQAYLYTFLFFNFQKLNDKVQHIQIKPKDLNNPQINSITDELITDELKISWRL